MRGHRPEVLILDLNMPGGRASRRSPTSRSLAGQTRIVVLTMQSEPAFAREAMQAGVLGYILKEAADAELVEGGAAAADGQTYLKPDLGARMAAARPSRPARRTTSPSARWRSCG